MQEFSRKELEVIDCDLGKFAATLYLFTVEFGYIKTSDGMGIYSVHLVSSKCESLPS